MFAPRRFSLKPFAGKTDGLSAPGSDRHRWGGGTSPKKNAKTKKKRVPAVKNAVVSSHCQNGATEIVQHIDNCYVACS